MIHKYWCQVCGARLEHMASVCEKTSCLKTVRPVGSRREGPVEESIKRFGDVNKADRRFHVTIDGRKHRFYDRATANAFFLASTGEVVSADFTPVRATKIVQEPRGFPLPVDLRSGDLLIFVGTPREVVVHCLLPSGGVSVCSREGGWPFGVGRHELSAFPLSVGQRVRHRRTDKPGLIVEENEDNCDPQRWRVRWDEYPADAPNAFSHEMLAAIQ